jgi:hypothetical protein
MQRRWVIVIVALVSVVVVKSIFIPNKMLVQSGPTTRHVSYFGLYFSQPHDLKTFPTDVIPEP